MPLKAKYERSYKKTNVNGVAITVYVYSVTGSKEEMAEYAEVQGTYLTVDKETGKTLWFATKPIGKTGTLGITTANENGERRVYADMSELEMASAMANQFPGAVGNAIAKAAINKLYGTTATTATAGPASDDIDDVE